MAVAKGLLGIKFQDADIAELDVVGLTVVLKSDVASHRPVFHGALVKLQVNDLLAIEFDLQVIANASDNHTIPLVRWSRQIF
jgi:hypothetical protein